MSVPEARRLKELEAESAFGRGASGHSRVKDCPRGKVGTPQDKREAVFWMVLECYRSERRACALVEILRDGYRNPAPPSPL
jgi:hypothetical protein